MTNKSNSIFIINVVRKQLNGLVPCGWLDVQYIAVSASKNSSWYHFILDVQLVAVTCEHALKAVCSQTLVPVAAESCRCHCIDGCVPILGMAQGCGCRATSQSCSIHLHGAVGCRCPEFHRQNTHPCVGPGAAPWATQLPTKCIC